MRRALAAASIVIVSGCGLVRGCTSSQPPIHLNPSMDDQPKLLPQDDSAFFYDGAGMRLPVEGTVARGALREDDALFLGKDASGAFVTDSPVPVDDAILARGASRYAIYCQPCHDPHGDGKGILAQRGGVPTASLHSDKLKPYPVGQLFDVITNGSGLMAGYKWPIPPRDRWAIIAHVRKLQRERQDAIARRSAP